MGRQARPTKGKKKDRRLLVSKVRKKEGARVSDLETRLAGALKREAEALAQQTATSEILRAISSSPTDVQPVFDIIAERAVNLCDAELSVVTRFDGTVLQIVALYGVTRESWKPSNEARTLCLWTPKAFPRECYGRVTPSTSRTS